MLGNARNDAGASQRRYSPGDMCLYHGQRADAVSATTGDDQHLANAFDLFESQPGVGARGGLGACRKAVSYVQGAAVAELCFVEGPI